MMIATQKLTSLAFAFYDGSKPIDSLNEDQKSQFITYKIKYLTSILDEYF